MKPTVFLLLIILSGVTKCSRILILFPATSTSHYILGSSLARGLAEAGHDVTILSPYEDKNPPPKNGTFREVILTGIQEEKKKSKGDVSRFLQLANMNPVFFIPFMNLIGNDITRKTLEHPNFKKLLNSEEHFDVVILEQFLADPLKAVAYHYKAPLILFSTIGANALVNPLVGNPAPPSYIAEVFLGYTPPFSFWQRVVSFIFRILTEFNFHFIFKSTQNKMMKEHFPNAPDLDVLNYNASLVLLNSHESTNQPMPHVPNMIDIGGFHIKPASELPPDLKDFMDNAKEGVVYFSMGSAIKPSQMPNETRDAILGALRKIKQKVLWKWDEDSLPEKPENVKLSTWFPQQEILAHPNTKLFITHGGLLSTTETVYHGVPVLSFPIFADQKTNAAFAEKNGIGITLPFFEITEQKLSSALNMLLGDSKYRDAVKTRSMLMHDRPVKPLDLAIYWIEFVIRHKGAPHLRVAAIDLPWYQYLLLDVIAVIVLISISALVITYTVIKKIFCKTNVSKVKLKKT